MLHPGESIQSDEGHRVLLRKKRPKVINLGRNSFTMTSRPYEAKAAVLPVKVIRNSSEASTSPRDMTREVQLER
jgi:hypothetical protein